MTPIEKIEKGILDADWSLISSAFKDLTGKTIPFQPNVKNQPDLKIIQDRINDIFMQYVQPTTSLKSQDTIDSEDELVVDDNGQDVDARQQGAIDRIKKKVVFIGGPVNDNEKAINEQYAKQRKKKLRPPKKIIRTTCLNCGDKFDSITKDNVTCNQCIKNIISSKKGKI